MKLVDSHCHLDKLTFHAQPKVPSTTTHLNNQRRPSGDYPENLDAALNNARARGVGGFLCIGTDLEGFQVIREIAEAADDIWCSAGVHPLTDLALTDFCETDLRALVASSPKVVAVGECGLDYYYQSDRRNEQIALFEKQLSVALTVDKPVIVHTRNAREDTMSLLTEYCQQGLTGVLHCFTESLEMAAKAVDMGFYISFSGIITFNNAEPLREVVRALPLNRILVETDSPYLAPAPHRGKNNLPQWVVEVAQTIADIKKCSLEEVAEITTENFQQLFRLQF